MSVTKGEKTSFRSSQQSSDWQLKDDETIFPRPLSFQEEEEEEDLI